MQTYKTELSNCLKDGKGVNTAVYASLPIVSGICMLGFVITKEVMLNYLVITLMIYFLYLSSKIAKLLYLVQGYLRFENGLDYVTLETQFCEYWIYYLNIIGFVVILLMGLMYSVAFLVFLIGNVIVSKNMGLLCSNTMLKQIQRRKERKKKASAFTLAIKR